MAVLKLLQIRRQVFRRNVDVSPLDAAFQICPEGFNRIRVHLTTHVLASAVIDGTMGEAPELHELENERGSLATYEPSRTYFVTIGLMCCEVRSGM